MAPGTRIAFIGAGNIASAMVRGLIERRVLTPAAIACTSRTGETARSLARDTGIGFEPDLPGLLGNADIVVIAFKPQSLAAADPRLRQLTRGKLVISVLAGKRIERLQRSFPEARNIVRTMPNTPAAIGAGVTAYCAATPLSAADRASVEALLGALGRHLEVEESHMDAVTAVSGGGPALLFEFVAALRDAGVAAGLPHAVAATLATETVLGSARLLARTGGDPETLRDKVISPNGTTYAGLQVLAANRFRDIIRDTIHASARRAAELAAD